MESAKLRYGLLSTIPLRMIAHTSEPPMTTDLLDDLAEYINVLSTGMKKTKNAQNRSLYLEHLAAAALIFQSLQQSNFQRAQQVAEEQRQFGWSFLPGEEGSAAEAAFVGFKKLFEGKTGQ